jgi:hypothetical protein
MLEKLRRWWPVVKPLIGLAIVILIGRRFLDDLRRPELWEQPVLWSAATGWLFLSGVLYLAGLGCSAFFWGRLLHHLGQRPPAYTVARAYYVGQLGKYIPGKAWALLMRAALVRQGGSSVAPPVPWKLAGLTSFYEVLTMMAAGSLLAVILFAFLGTDVAAPPSLSGLVGLVRGQVPAGGVLGRWQAALLAGLLALATGLPLWPGVFNRIAPWLELRAPGNTDGVSSANPGLPRIRLLYLAEGLGLLTLGWLLLGSSVGVTLQGILGHRAGSELTWAPAILGRVTASLAVAYVAGFVILIAPGGIGVRDFLLTLLLAPELTALTNCPGEVAWGLAALTAVVLRLVWTLAELLLALGLYLIPGGVRADVASAQEGNPPPSPSLPGRLS